MNISAVIKQPSAIIPIAVSLAALAMVLSHIALFGVVHEVDEGTAAHLFQLLIGFQISVIAFFAVKWPLRSTRQPLPVMALQTSVALAAPASVFFHKL